MCTMVSPKEQSLVYNIKLSSVGPGHVTGQDVVHEPRAIDLALKLHYIRAVYYFRSPAFEGSTILTIKEPLFAWFNHYAMTCGRFRRSESGRPYIKCNDCGARFIVAQCDKTIDEWVGMKDNISLQKLLVSDKVLGPELEFSPPVLIQMTRFKCGGMSVGLSWAHVLGDAFVVSDFINMWGQVAAGHHPSRTFKPTRSPTKTENPNPPNPARDPLSAKRVNPVGDHWITGDNSKSETFSVHITAAQLNQLQSKVSGSRRSNKTDEFAPFETLCAVIWKSIAKIRDGSEPRTVTICQKDSNDRLESEILSNRQVISVVKLDFSVTESDPQELAKFIRDRTVDERQKIEEAMEIDNGLSDFIVYGANLTFVNLEEAALYDLEFKGQKPVFASYSIDGVGDEGVVLVLPPPEDGGKNGGGGRILTFIMRENEVAELKSELEREWSIA